ncbi:MAG: methylmalonyl-CoA mutase, partial [Saprospiraceae bacterium]|nr:methylmalonyl-CoA mutase [Saprospiraceae bacterium]
VNTFLGSNGSPLQVPREVIRATVEEKESQIHAVRNFQKRNASAASVALQQLKQAAVRNQNTFAELMEVAKIASLGQISAALYEVGGQYRRNM